MVGNGGPYGGGGIYLEESNATVINCTIVANLAESSGGGIRSYNSAPRITNCIVRGNTPDEITGTKPIVSFSNVEGGYEGAGNIDADAMFADPDSGDFHLLTGSPCIDAGDTNALPDYVIGDLDGLERPVDDPDTADTGAGYPCVDMGAYEFQGESSCPEDITGNGAVNIDDLFEILGHFGDGAGIYDVNGDGVVNLDDVLAVIDAWGPCE